MVFNELRKIYNLRTLLLLTVVGCVLFYSWAMSQMNLSHLPLFETVEAENGTVSVEKYGVTWEEAELEEIRQLAAERAAALDSRVALAYPAVTDMGFSGWEELNDFVSSDGEQGSIADIAEGYTLEDAWALQQEIYGDLEREVLEKEYFCEIAGFAQDGDSTLPASVFSNMGFVLSDYFRILMYLVWILVLPFPASDNIAGVRQVTASCRYGRRLAVKQMEAMVLAAAVLLAVSGAVLYAACRLCTPYDPFYDCPVPGIWPDWTFGTYLVMKVAVVSAAALGLALIYFFLSSLCRTIVGMAVMAIPCWGLGELLTMQVFHYLFQTPEMADGVKIRGRSFYMDWLAGFEYFPQALCGALLLVGLVLCGALVRRRQTEDVVE